MAKRTTFKTLIHAKSLKDVEKQFISLNNQVNNFIPEKKGQVMGGVGLDKKGNFIVEKPKKWEAKFLNMMAEEE